MDFSQGRRKLLEQLGNSTVFLQPWRTEGTAGKPPEGEQKSKEKNADVNNFYPGENMKPWMMWDWGEDRQSRWRFFESCSIKFGRSAEEVKAAWHINEWHKDVDFTGQSELPFILAQQKLFTKRTKLKVFPPWPSREWSNFYGGVCVSVLSSFKISTLSKSNDF